MAEFLKNPWFWVSVILVAMAVNFAYNLITKKGKLF